MSAPCANPSIAALNIILKASPQVTYPKNRAELLNLALGNGNNGQFDVGYDIPGKGVVLEAQVARCNNGIAVNYMDPYMRRRDPDCVVIGDNEPTDKVRYEERYGEPFAGLREQTLSWLATQKLIVVYFRAGGDEIGYPSVLVLPENAAFFALALADLQGFIAPDELTEEFAPQCIVFVAPVFRHTHFSGEQVVVHHRTPAVHEIFSYNLYPGPSAKKGIYGVLLTIGERERWLTAHAATAQLTTPYDNVFTIMHEGASGSGKSEMLEEIHRQPDGRVLVGQNSVTGERMVFPIGDTCTLYRITDDMALCHPAIQTDARKLMVADAEKGWFLRIDHITEYGTDPLYERLTIHPEQPLVFLNIKGVPGSTCLLWEHTEDEPGKRCPNPRVIMPRHMVPNTIDGPVPVDLRSFGFRTPPCTREKPTYGIVGMLHILPPALAWLWRLVAPRGHANPSIIGDSGLASEGVGSYWPFATGKYVDHANLLLEQILAAPATRFALLPNQYIGAWRVGFMPEWIGREYLARRGSAKFRPEQLVASRCALLGLSPQSMRVDGNVVPRSMLFVHEQPEVGVEGYDTGAGLLVEFFKRELRSYLAPELHPLGRQIIECCLSDGKVEDYQNLIQMM